MKLSRDFGFWRNLALVALAHVAVFVALLRMNSASVRAASTPEIVWMNSELNQQPTAIVEPEEQTVADENDQRDETEQNEIPVLSATPKSTPKEKPATTPKKIAGKKSAPKIAAAKSEKPKSKTADNVQKSAASATAGSEQKAEAAQQFSWYGNMLHDRFYRSWVQPTSIGATGAKLSALVHLRIEKDGRVSQFELARPSGNVVVDESVAEVAKRVPQVDPLPAGLGGAHYDVRINFELSQD